MAWPRGGAQVRNHTYHNPTYILEWRFCSGRGLRVDTTWSAYCHLDTHPDLTGRPH